jgi:hypothetical protein
MSYRRVFRAVNYVVLGGCLLVVSLMLKPGLGWFGFALPWLLVGAAYLFVTIILDIIIYWLRRMAAERGQAERD